jgi:inositol oxygenase
MASKRQQVAELDGFQERRAKIDHESLDAQERKAKIDDEGPLVDLDEIDDAKREALALVDGKLEEDPTFNPVDKEKKQSEFRNYANSARQGRVEKFYRLQHTLQTYDFVLDMEKKWLSKFKGPRPLSGMYMGIWEALEYLEKVVDDSDPDTNLSQLAHALQTSEAIREKWPGEEYDWFVLTGLIHDLGKIIAITDEKIGLVGEPQWAVVGDTFPVGLPFSDKNVFHEYFEGNPDSKDPRFNSGLGVYKPGCGLMNIHMSWGHDEYMYHVCKENGSTLPLQALYMIRFHSFYPWHKEGAYSELMNDQDKEMLKWVLEFNPFDLYSKAHENPDVESLKPYYQKLIRKYFPEKLLW